MYGDPSYWVYIYNYDDNVDVINNIINDNYIDIETFASNPIYLKGVKLKIPKEIEYYSNQFNTTTLKKVS
jgi:hypothetical protein